MQHKTFMLHATVGDTALCLLQSTSVIEKNFYIVYLLMNFIDVTVELARRLEKLVTKSTFFHRRFDVNSNMFQKLGSGTAHLVTENARVRGRRTR